MVHIQLEIFGLGWGRKRLRLNLLVFNHFSKQFNKLVMRQSTKIHECTAPKQSNVYRRRGVFLFSPQQVVVALYCM